MRGVITLGYQECESERKSGEFPFCNVVGHIGESDHVVE